MDKITLQELKDFARGLDFELDLLEQGNFQRLVASNISEVDFLLNQLRLLIEKIEDTK